MQRRFATPEPHTQTSVLIKFLQPPCKESSIQGCGVLGCIAVRTSKVACVGERDRYLSGRERPPSDRHRDFVDEDVQSGRSVEEMNAVRSSSHFEAACHQSTVRALTQRMCTQTARATTSARSLLGKSLLWFALNDSTEGQVGAVCAGPWAVRRF